MFFADAAERKVVRRNPTIGWDADRHLPPIEDKERGWRSRAGFTLEQVVTLTTDPRIPEDRRVLYAIRFLGGPRPGEAANARWRNLDRARRPLWRLTLESSFNSPMRREKGTKTGAELNIPVHPVLQRMLESWEASGWEEFMGRAPEPDDLIVPRADGKQRLVSTSYKQFLADLATVRINAQRQYESRATFRNLALAAGVPKYQVDLITHPKPTQGPDYYARLDMLWSGLCAAVSAIDASAWNGRLSSLGERVTPEVTPRVTPDAPQNEKPPTSLKNVEGKMERKHQRLRRRPLHSPPLPPPRLTPTRKGFEPTRARWANWATTHANPHKAPVPQRFPALPFSASVLPSPHQSSEFL
jgi:hypothetical protein